MVFFNLTSILALQMNFLFNLCYRFMEKFIWYVTQRDLNYQMFGMLYVFNWQVYIINLCMWQQNNEIHFQ